MRGNGDMPVSKEVRVEKVRDAIKRMNGRKAPGMVGVKVGMLKAGMEGVAE